MVPEGARSNASELLEGGLALMLPAVCGKTLKCEAITLPKGVNRLQDALGMGDNM